MVNLCEVRREQLARSTLLISKLVPLGSFLDLLKSIQMVKREWGAGNNGRLCSFSNLFVTSPTSQLIIQLFHRFTYVTAHSPTLPLSHLRHSSFSNLSIASPTSQALHLRHLASRPWQNSISREIYAIENIFLLSIIEEIRKFLHYSVAFIQYEATAFCCVFHVSVYFTSITSFFLTC